MKRLNLTLCALACALALSACGRGASSAPASTAAPEPTASAEPSALPDTPEDAAPGVGDMMDMAAPDEELANTVALIYAEKPVELMMGETMAVYLTNADLLTYNVGLTTEQAAALDAAVISESMTGSQAYSLAALRVKPGEDPAALAQTILDTVDPAKWICVMADKVRCNVYGDVIVFCMSDSNLVDADAMMDAATAVLGAPDTTLTRDAAQ